MNGGSGVLRWPLAVGAAAAAAGLALVLERPLGEAPLPLFFAAVMLSAWYGGLGPGLLATALSGAALDYFFEEPRGNFGIAGPVTVLRLGLYAAAAVLISWLNGQRRAAAARAEAARREAEHLAAIVESSEDAVVGVDLAGTVTAWNTGAERLYGYARADIVGTPFARLVLQDEPNVLPRIFEQLGRGARFGHFETVRVAKSGRRLDVSVAASPVRDAAGAVVGASLIERDTSAARGAAEAAERLAAIVRSSQDAILAKTLDGTITAWNPAAERLYGYAAHEAIGCSVEMLVPPERRDELRRLMERVAAGEPTEGLETVRVRRDGRRLRVRLTVAPLRGPNQRVVGASAIARPVGER